MWSLGISRATDGLAALDRGDGSALTCENLCAFEVAVKTETPKPWTVALPMVKTDDLIYEYACHEGNYGMEGILAGARALEKKSTNGGNRR